MSFPSIDKYFFTLSNHSLIFCNIYLLYLINAKNEITEPRTQSKYTLPNRKAFAIHNLSIIGLFKKNGRIKGARMCTKRAQKQVIPKIAILST